MIGDLVTADGAAEVASGAPPFEGLFRAHADRLVRLAHLLGADDPEDVVQEAFCRLYAVPPDREDGQGRCAL